MSPPMHIYRSPQFKFASISQNSGFATIPKEVLEDPEINRIEIEDTSFEELPPGLFDMTQLKHLELVGNQVEELPDDIGKLTNLRTLIVEESLLRYIPQSLFALPEMRKLEITSAHHTPFETIIPPSIKHMKHLRYLKLDRVGLSELPAEFLTLQKLEKLDLRWNMLSDLPDQLAGMDKLKTAILSSNHLRHMPAVPQMKSLQELRLANNPIKFIPPRYMEAIMGLTAISFQNCQLKAPNQRLTKEIGKSLTNLFVLGNPKLNFRKPQDEKSKVKATYRCCAQQVK